MYVLVCAFIGHLWWLLLQINCLPRALMCVTGHSSALLYVCYAFELASVGNYLSVTYNPVHSLLT